MSEQIAPLVFEPESAHEKCAIEWWFVQGTYEGSSGRRHFMTTLFRSNLAADEGGMSNGFQLLLTVLDPEQDADHRASTWTDRASLDAAVHKLKTTESHIDAAVQKALTLELEQGGPPFPIVLREDPVRFAPDPLSAEWRDFEIAQREDGFELRFCEPGTQTPVHLTLTPTVPLLEVGIRIPGLPSEDDIAYRCYPRADVRGTTGDGEAVRGQAWIDHQWGGIGWFWDSQKKFLIGWDWFGINLEDGSDWVVMQHRDARTGRILATNATVRSGAGPRRATMTVEVTPTRYWESPTTRIRYPVEWQIEVPEMEASFSFRPLVDAQEVSSFGTLRTVWEGAGTVTGTVAGEAVAGRARGEFHGYGYIFDYGDYLQAMGHRVDRHLEALLPRRFALRDVERFIGPARWKHEPAAYTEMISTPVWDLIDRSGKRWRPIFGILLLEALGVETLPYERLVCVMTELLHSGALIVDDIEDASELRRGQESLHLRYGLDVALNAANSLYFLPAVELMSHPVLPPEQRRRLHEIKERVCIEAHCGQLTDIYWSRTLSPERLEAWMAEDLEAKILQMYDLKTGAGARGLAESVAVVANADPARTAACVEFARAFAVAFQIVDDVLNFSSSERWTKVRGEDIVNGKPTYVIATALRRMEPTRAARLRRILCSPELRGSTEGLAEGIELVHESGALEACHEQARVLTEEGWSAFSSHLRASEPKIMLHAMCLRTIDLAYDA